MSQTIAAAFVSFADANRAVEMLQDAGFAHDDISVLVAESNRAQHFQIAEGDKAAEGALGGGLAGGGLGALAAGLVSIGVIAAPGLGLVAAGPLVAALAGAGAGAATGGLLGGLVGLGIPEHHAKVLHDQVERGGILIAVACDTPAREVTARETLHRAGATSLSHAS